MTKVADYDRFFQQATEFEDGPYGYQRRLAEEESFPTLLDIPTGLGKTAAVILAWLYRRRVHPDKTVRKETPRRLVYCLPMRTLVEQTADTATKWIKNLARQDRSFHDNPITVHVLMGGAEETTWDEHPEQDAILIGTQDMLLSRALNRGYGMSRYRWPITFSLLNNDCLWVLDETQLMGVGVTTSAQLQGFRARLKTFGITQSLWMSATLDKEMLSTVDHQPTDGQWNKLGLTDDLELLAVKKLFRAKKPCQQCSFSLTGENEKGKYESDIAERISQAHRAGTLTLAVVNRVQRAQNIFLAIQEYFAEREDAPEIFLIHSRFRPIDRVAVQEKALDEKTISPDGPGRIIVSTQAIEAGVDVSATTLFTELAPWSSMVQRFGRCNRRGTCGKDGHPEALVSWIDIDTSDPKKVKGLTLPYSTNDLNTARDHISAIDDVGPKSLQAVAHTEERPVVHTIRCRDLLDLWDTTPDLAGNDLDVSRYIRDTEDTDVQIYWREWNKEEDRGKPPNTTVAGGQETDCFPSREELCAVSIGDAKRFLGKLKNDSAWWWNPLDGEWERIDASRVRPGMVILLHANAGGYDSDIGWTGEFKDKPMVVQLPHAENGQKDIYGADDAGKEPLSLTDHLQKVIRAAESLKKTLNGASDGFPWDSIVTAASWHDVGKAHEAFQNAMRESEFVAEMDPNRIQLWAKSGKQGILRYQTIETNVEGNTRPVPRRGFRHELASVLAWLAAADGQADADLVAFLIAAHHGKVRGSIRSLPNENQPPDPGVKFARGLWEGDEIPAVDLGDGRMTPKVTVDLSLMELGEDEHGRPSWLARVLKLRDEYGPFRLAYLEMLLRIADWRGSNHGGTSDA